MQGNEPQEEAGQLFSTVGRYTGNGSVDSLNQALQDKKIIINKEMLKAMQEAAFK